MGSWGVGLGGGTEVIVHHSDGHPHLPLAKATYCLCVGPPESVAWVCSGVRALSVRFFWKTLMWVMSIAWKSHSKCVVWRPKQVWDHAACIGGPGSETGGHGEGNAAKSVERMPSQDHHEWRGYRTSASCLEHASAKWAERLQAAGGGRVHGRSVEGSVHMFRRCFSFALWGRPPACARSCKGHSRQSAIGAPGFDRRQALQEVAPVLSPDCHGWVAGAVWDWLTDAPRPWRTVKALNRCRMPSKAFTVGGTGCEQDLLLRLPCLSEDGFFLVLCLGSWLSRKHTVAIETTRQHCLESLPHSHAGG